MSKQNQKRNGGTIGWAMVLGFAALAALALVPVLAGTASAAPIQAATVQPAGQWAYGGEGYSNGSTTVNSATITWNAMFGWTVIYTATNTSPTTVMLEEQRTVGISLVVTLSSPNATGAYTYHASESDVAFVNLTNASTVYVNGTPVPALGIDNESLAVQATVDQSVTATAFGIDHSAFLNVSGVAQGSVQFAPSLGLIPLNLSGVTEWNSSAISTPQANWNIAYNWAEYRWDGATNSGSGSAIGSWTTSGPINLTGSLVEVNHVWIDHQPRIGILLVVQGPVDAYDGFILVPHGFDLFGGAAHPYDPDSLGSASVGSGEGQTLFVSNTPRGPMVTAAETTFGATAVPAGSGSVLGQASSGPAPAATSGDSPSAVVYGEPMSIAQAQAESACLTNGCGPAASGGLGGLLGVAAIALAVVAVVGTVSVIEWRSYARRRSQKGLVGGYGESWTNGPPPGSVEAPPASGLGPNFPQGPQPPRP